MNIDDLIARMVEQQSEEPDIEETTSPESEPAEASVEPEVTAESSDEPEPVEEPADEPLEATEDAETDDAELPVEEPRAAADESLSLEEPSSEDDGIEQDIEPSEMPAETEPIGDDFPELPDDPELELSGDVRLEDDPLESPMTDREVADEPLNVESFNQPTDRMLGFDNLESESAPESYRQQASRMVEVKLPDGWEGDIAATVQQRMRETQEVINSHLDDELGGALYQLDMMGMD